MKSLSKKMLSAATAGTLCAAFALGVPAAAQAADGDSVIRNRTIGYVTTQLHWTVYQTADGKAECPRGTSPNGPREVFKALFPNLGPVEKTQLARESLKMYPTDAPAQFEYYEPLGTTALGLNLDGKVGPKDFTTPMGEKGIDNAFYRVIGCNSQFRGPEGQLQLFANKQIPGFGFDRILLEVTDVDSLNNDPDVNVTIYRGRDPMLLDATGEKVAPGGTQRVDTKYGQKVVQHFHGKIVDGVLTTEAKDGNWPWQIYPSVPLMLKTHDMRFSMKLTPQSADGLIAGYTDNESLYKWLISWSTHHLSYGQLEAPEFYWQIRKQADAYPDKDGKMTAISSAITLNMAQVFIQHDDAKVADAVPAQQPATGKLSQDARR
jgi:hypothetical protein